MTVRWNIRPVWLIIALGSLLITDGVDRTAFARAAKGQAKEKPVTAESLASAERPMGPRPSEATQSKSLKAGAKKPEQQVRKAHRHNKKTILPKADLQPKPDLSYLGKFEQPQRYDPSRDYRRGGPPNPQAGDVLHDHFQELDRNRDGMIDPFERASGRLDMDRDLANRRR